MSHGSARLTVHGRLMIVQRDRAGCKQAHFAAMGVSRKCARTWIDRCAAEGEAGRWSLGQLGRTLRRHKTSDEVEQKVLPACAAALPTGRTGPRGRSGGGDGVTDPAPPLDAYLRASAIR